MEIIAQRIFGHKDTALGLSLSAISARLKTAVVARKRVSLRAQRSNRTNSAAPFRCDCFTALAMTASFL
jgi:hypothetical protein